MMIIAIIMPLAVAVFLISLIISGGKSIREQAWNKGYNLGREYRQCSPFEKDSALRSLHKVCKDQNLINGFRQGMELV